MYDYQGWKDTGEAFEQAIKEGRLSDKPGAWNYAGDYMYMGPTTGGKADAAKQYHTTCDAFKHIVTRQYLPLLALQY